MKAAHKDQAQASGAKSGTLIKAKVSGHRCLSVRKFRKPNTAPISAEKFNADIPSGYEDAN
jgi:hypothetical protein